MENDENVRPVCGSAMNDTLFISHSDDIVVTEPVGIVTKVCPILSVYENFIVAPVSSTEPV